MPEVDLNTFSIKKVIDDADAVIKRMRESRSKAYWERNQLVAALSKVLPAHITHHDFNDENWDKEWRTIICIHGPEGQMTWHVHDADVHYFKHLIKFGKPNCNGWDGHTTDEKYRRLSCLPESPTAVKEALGGFR